MPAVQRMLESESGLTVDRCLSPDEAISHGAAIYAGLLLGSDVVDLQDMSVKNVNSHHLGVLGVERATGRKRRQVMISRNTVLPARSVCRFKTLKDNQPSVEVNVIEGGDDSGNDATQIGRCIVSGLPAGLPADTPVEVTFQYESNGRLAIGAKVPSVDKQAQLEIERATGLASDEIEYWSSRINSGFGLQDADSVPPPAVDEIAEAPAPPPVPAEVAEPPGPPPLTADPVVEQAAPQSEEPTAEFWESITGADEAVPVDEQPPPLTHDPEPVVEAGPDTNAVDVAATPTSEPDPSATSTPKSGGWKSRRTQVTAGDEESST